MPINGLYVIINKADKKPASLLHFCEQVLQGGADVIQFRDKSPLSKETVCLAKELSTLCQQFHVPFIVNDHPYLAKQINANGVHIGQGDGGIQKARQTVGNNLFIGATVSTVKEAKKAAKEGADYISCGHIYPTTTKKKTYGPVGLSTLQQVVGSTSLPVAAIGGITVERIPPILATGAAAAVVVSAVEKDPLQACIKLKEALSCNLKN